MVVTADGMAIEVMPEQPKKEPSPIEVTADGMVIDVKLEQ